MKRILLLIVFSFIYLLSFSQDLIVTNEGDSINCKITKVKQDYIYFTFNYKDEIRNTLISVSQVKNYKTGYFKQSEIPMDKIKIHGNYSRFRLAINGGYSYETAKISESVPTDFVNYAKDLKSGYHLGGDLTYFVAEQLGFGLRYYLFMSSNSMDNIYVDDINGNRRYGSMSDDIKIFFIGPAYSTRFLNGNKTNAFLMNLSLGYMGFNDNKVVIDNYKVTGNALGLSLDIGYDISISKNLMLGFQIAFITASISKFYWNDGTTTQTVELESGKYESLNRLDFSVGLRWLK